MRTGILLRTIVAMNVLVLAVGGAVGWLGAQAAGELVEQRLLGQVSENAAGLVGRLNLPITPTLMGHLKRIFDVDVAIRQADGEWLASSLPGKDTATLRRKLKGDPVPETLTLADGAYRLRLQPVPAGRHGRPDARRLELLLLVPVEQIAQARTAAQRRVAVVAIPAVAAATVLAAVLSLTIARPIRRLAGQMDRMASSSDPELHAAIDRASEPGGPREVARLSESFDHLLDRLDRAQAELARRERLAAVGTMSAAVAHELRNPLSGIKMNARLLRDELTEAAPAETLELMLGEIDRMDHTLQELLDLASTSPEGATIEVSPSAVNVADVAASVAQLLAGKFRHAGVSLETTVSADLPAARADARRLRQVLMNLLLNALAATPAGGRVAIDAHAEAETVQLRVCDTGAGLDATQQEGVFEPFVSDTPGGAGLGLYVSRSIVEACGGTLEYSDTAEGGCFVVTLGRA
jgi:signal transduction histidine kinase